jgi:hypothetical protein
MNFIRRIVELITKAQEIATKNGYPNLLQPGLVKEMVVADILGHEVSREKHQPDAFDPNDSSRQFEYLSCFENGTFQLDRMFKAPAAKRQQSLTRITRNAMIYCAVFERANPLTVVGIWEIEPHTMLVEAERQLDASQNDISHIGFTRKWARDNGKCVYSKES